METFILYSETKELVSELSDIQTGILFKAVFAYAADGIEPEFEDGLIKLAFISIRQQIDRNYEKYQAVIEKRRQNGLKGGRPKKDETQETPAPDATENTNNTPAPDTKETSNNTPVSDTMKNTNHTTVYDTPDKKEEIPFESLQEEEKQILINFAKRQKAKNPTAYIRKILNNGDFKEVLKQEIKKLNLINQTKSNTKPKPPPMTENEIKQTEEILQKLRRKFIDKEVSP